MQRWEYLTAILEANADREADFLMQYRDWKGPIPEFTVEALMPRLNALGEQGWELVSLTPQFVGSRGDLLTTDGSGSRTWTSKFFGVFKRPKAD
ncbi:MAG: hypothetical protein J0M07_05830 [Anaerolineae bacterium]|uniref:hypothetical protein n=1 Tax=Candidatus Flexifilum breve TaxID=3140694 RepID=UPI001AC14B15|nr:hypothetical protein [Chloroflexota bacterium]MBK9746805.1 hypothetical protein [Chloroflexota bacterium]MBN8634825.1 hypothetical protein [Anaerolineae bacterium]